MGNKLSGKDLIKLGFPKNNSINIALGQINRYRKREKKESILTEAKDVLLNPEKYEGKFPKGKVNINQCIGYTDFALKRFFEEAKKQPWYNNTIFVLVADHGNTIAYDEYRKEFNKHTVPILFFTPNEKYVGVDDNWAQQIDIYPTLLDMIGYKKPFRSWGRSLINEKQVPPFVIKYGANVYQFMSGNYICTFDGNKVVGFYDKKDKDLKNNLIAKRNSEMDLIELKCKAYLQDYMARVMDKKLAQH